jgi:NAD(P)-dependent dehydrogenase (short-subunit alcohol dehydrogenase family)
MSLEGQVAVVTGGRRGIGKDSALVLAEAGADVAICDLVTDTGELAAVAEEIQKMGRRSLARKVDARNQSDINQMVQEVVQQFGRIDILVNNAGIGSGFGPTEPEKWEEQQKRSQEHMAQLADKPRISLMTEQDWDTVISTNMKSVLLFSQAVSPHMVKNRKGVIVNVASVMAYSKGAAALSAYSVSKSGIVMLTQGLAADLGRWGIRVNSIAPGAIETEMMRYVWANELALKMIENRILLGNKMLQPLHCAHLIYFLTTELAAYITGQTIIVDGGLTIAPGGQTG